METRLASQLDFSVVFYKQMDRCGDLSSKVHSENGSMQAGVYNYKQAVDHLSSTVYRYWDDDYLKRVDKINYTNNLIEMLEQIDMKYQQIMNLSFRAKVIREEPLEYYGPEK